MAGTSGGLRAFGAPRSSSRQRPAWARFRASRTALMSFFRSALLAALAVALAPAPAAQADCRNGTAIVSDVGSFPCRNVDLVGYLPRATFAVGTSGAAGHNDIWGWTDPETGVEYALVGTENGLGFVDLSTPSEPRLVGKLPASGQASSWRDVKVYGDHAYVVADSSPGHGVQAFDLTRLRGATGAPVLFTEDARYTGIGSAHNIVINEETGYGYVVGARRVGSDQPAECGARGFHVIDLRDPPNMTFVTCFSDAARDANPRITAGYTHDAQCVVYRGPDADYRGREVCLGANEDVVTVFDVQDKSDVQIVSQAAYPNDAYTHQGWFDASQRYFLINDEIDERNGLVPFQRTIVMDFLDLDDPEVAFVYDSGLTTIDHNLYVRGRYAFESNYQSGLRILDLDQIGSGTLTEVAFFDTYPASDGLSYDGNWSNYPYFESGLVIANDISNGLFVLRPAAALAVATEEGPAGSGYALSAPFPNPSSDGARLTLRVDDGQRVVAELFDVAGRRVASVFDGAVGSGQTVELEVRRGDLPAAVYLVRVRGEGFEASRRLVLTR